MLYPSLLGFLIKKTKSTQHILGKLVIIYPLEWALKVFTLVQGDQYQYLLLAQTSVVFV
jgi:hypothetical protein